MINQLIIMQAPQNERVLNNLPEMKTYFKEGLIKNMAYDQYNNFSVIDKNSEQRKKFSEIFNQMNNNKHYEIENLQLKLQEKRGIGSLLGLAIADALGASTQFIAFDKNRKDLIQNGFDDIIDKIRKNILQPRHGKVGVWTDDCSMALCLADSLLLSSFNFDPQHIRYMFVLWLEHGLNNGGRPRSIGLGGNISISMNQFMDNQTDYAVEGTKFNNGNGSLMRLAPVPIAFYRQEEKAMEYSEKQSRTTHNGIEAKQCCRLLCLIIVRLINRKEQQNWRDTLQQACKQFKTQQTCLSVLRLAASERQTENDFKLQKDEYKSKFTKFNKNLDDRNWNWKDENFTYSPTRNKQQPGYIGSYCMDALSMALHIVWHTKSFKQAVIWSANMGGDCDTVGAIAGQIAGAAYGITQEMIKLYSQMDDFKKRKYEVFLKGYKLMQGKNIE